MEQANTLYLTVAKVAHIALTEVLCHLAVEAIGSLFVLWDFVTGLAERSEHLFKYLVNSFHSTHTFIMPYKRQ
jgi:hypothetical protein